MTCEDQFGFAPPISLNAPPESVTSDLIANGAVKNRHISSDAQIDQIKIKDLPKDLNKKLSKDGLDRMGGPLDMGNFIIKNLPLPTEDSHAANKKYIDDLLTGNNSEFEAVNKAGDTMTGPLVLSGDPISNLQSATKQYVDNKLNNLGSGGDVFKGGDNTFIGSNTFTLPVIFQEGFLLQGNSSLTGSLQINGTLNITGATVFESGSITTLGRHPVTNFDAATKAYVDTSISQLHPGDAFKDQDNIFTGNNTFNGSVTLGSASNLDVQSNVFFHQLIEGTSGLNIQGPISLGSSSSITDIFGSTINIHDSLILSAGKTFTLGINPTANLHAATKQYVDNSIDARFGLNINIVENLTHLSLSATDNQMAYVQSLAALYIYIQDIETWIPYQINFYPNWIVTNNTEIAVDVMGNDIPTIISASPTGTTRFFLYRKSDLQIDVETTAPDMYNGIPGIIEEAGALKYVKPYIGSVLSNESVLVREMKINREVSRLETSVFASPTANNTSFLSLNLSAFMPITSNKAQLMTRLIVPAAGGPDLELYTRSFNSGLTTGLLSAGHWSNSGATETGSYNKFWTNTSNSKIFDYRFNRTTTTACNFYFLGYQEII